MYYWQDIKWEDYYKILGLPREASEEEIRQAVHGYEIAHHPDPLKDPAAKKRAEAAFKLGERAKDTLLNPTEKLVYDQAYDTRAKAGDPGPAATTGAKPGSGATPSPRPTSPPPPPKVYEPILKATASTGFTLTRVSQQMGGGGKYGVFIDGTQISKIHSSETIRLDLSPGRHTIQLRWGPFKSEMLTFNVQGGHCEDLICGEVPGSFGLGKAVIRASNGALLSLSDEGKPFKN